MEAKKPELSAAMRMRANEVWRLLKEKVCTKEELERRFYPNSKPGSHERQIRELIAIVAKKVPVISTSDSKGYWIASKPEDVTHAKHAWKEIDSRIEELDARRQPLIAFCEKYKEMRE